MERREAERFLRAAAHDTTKLVNTFRYPEEHRWYELTSLSQMLLCLAEGQIVNGPTLDEHGNYTCRVKRICAGFPVYVTFAVEPECPNRVIVQKLENRNDEDHY